MRLSELLDINLLADMLADGYVNRQYHPREPLAILNYSHTCQYAQAWNEVTTKTRGLIYNLDTEEVVARPFPKFFNASELGPSKLGQAMSKNVQVTDKLDGSLGILYPDPSHATGWAIATRGSFTSDQAIKGTMMLEDGYLNKGFDPSTESTYLFEIIYPENRIVLNYGTLQSLTLLATVGIETGSIGGPDSSHSWPGPRARIFPATSWKDAKTLPDRDYAEGYVIRNTETGFMVKMKQDDYVELHRMIFGMNERVVWQHLRDGSDTGLLFEGVPEEFWPWIERTMTRMGYQWAMIMSEVGEAFDQIYEDLRPGFTRKEFALEVTREKFSGPMYKYPGLLFRLLDGKPIADEVWKLVPYDGSVKMASEQSEDTA